MKHVELGIPLLKTKWITYENPDFVVSRYVEDNSLALGVMDDETSRPYTLSVNLSFFGLETADNEIFVKDYGQDEGLPNYLMEAGVADFIENIQIGHGHGARMKLTFDAESLVPKIPNS